ncbi:hypothetical protein [Actinocorallia sp. A-T 12471]|uniref:hypothetical protein n=1 Tax=Actinocorallia sp. A-T 12471 TaxID=3089813 RepID=UPI0029CEEB71|nr:hypothetical protein [Actinocorallia sp. A-T 12471]MDX6742639.1 hypothetical protein [Actinocorallia sp. A-T 12471]
MVGNRTVHRVGDPSARHAASSAGVTGTYPDERVMFQLSPPGSAAIQISRFISAWTE